MSLLSKSKLLLIGIILIGTYLRFYRLSDLMPFIADQGWFYISARDMILTGNVPLVGITSSHTWLHQGAAWTYTLVPLFKLFNFNPYVPAYFTAALGVITIFLVYKLSREMFDEKVAIISSFLFATSPLIVSDSRMAYHTSPIPFFVALLILFVYRLTLGNVKYFPVIAFLFAILYNLEIATFPIIVSVLMIIVYGIVKRKKWAINIFNKKTIFLSLLSFFIPMIPMIVYDLGHGFPQTVKFMVWLFYKALVIVGYLRLNPNAPGETWATFIPYTLDLIKKTIFLPSAEISLFILTTCFVFLGFRIFKDWRKKKNNLSNNLIFIFFLIPAFAYIGAKTNSAAYVLIFYPQLMIMIAILINQLIRNKKTAIGTSLLLVIFGIINSNLVIKQNYLTGPAFTKRIEAAKKIVNEAKGRPYNILGKGEGSQYESFVMPHQYLTWWLGHGPSKEDESLKFYVSEYIDRIVVEKRGK